MSLFFLQRKKGFNWSFWGRAQQQKNKKITDVRKLHNFIFRHIFFVEKKQRNNYLKKCLKKKYSSDIIKKPYPSVAPRFPIVDYPMARAFLNFSRTPAVDSECIYFEEAKRRTELDFGISKRNFFGIKSALLCPSIIIGLFDALLLLE